MPNSSREPRVLGQRQALWLALLSAIGVICVLWFAREESQELHGNTASMSPSREPALRLREKNNPPRSQDNSQSDGKSDSKIEREVRQYFDPNLDRYRALILEAQDAYAQLQRDNPIMDTGPKYADGLCVSLGRKYATEFESAMNERAKNPEELLERIRFANAYSQQVLPAVLLRALRSTDPVGDQELGAAVHAYISSDHYREFLRNTLSGESFGYLEIAEQVKAAKTTADLVSILERIAPRSNQEAAALLNSKLMTQAHMEAYAELVYAKQLAAMMRKNRDQIIAGSRYQTLISEAQAIHQNLQTQLGRLPPTDPTRIEMGTRLTTFYAEYNSLIARKKNAP